MSPNPTSRVLVGGHLVRIARTGFAACDRLRAQHRMSGGQMTPFCLVFRHGSVTPWVGARAALASLREIRSMLAMSMPIKVLADALSRGRRPFICGCCKLSDQLAIVSSKPPSFQYSRPLTVRSAGGMIFAFFHRSTVRGVTL